MEGQKISDTLNLIDSLKERYEVIAKETKKQTTDEEYVTWAEHFNNALAIVGAIIRIYVTEKQSQFKAENSLLYFRAIELLDHIAWIWTGVQYGMYHQAIRELRYVFESVLKAYYLDMEHPDASIAYKLEILKEQETTKSYLIGKRLINSVGKRLNLSQIINKQFQDLYRDLSRYVHCSYDELKPSIKQGKLKLRPRFIFDRELFNKYQELTNKTLAAVYFILWIT